MRSRLTTVAVMSVVTLGLAGCGHLGHSRARTSSRGSSAGHPSSTKRSLAGSSSLSTPASVRLTSRSAVMRFAQTYGEYLDGRRPAVRVAESSTIDVGIRIAPDARTGRLQVVSVVPAPLGRPSGFVLRDRTHTIRFTVAIARVQQHLPGAVLHPAGSRQRRPGTADSDRPAARVRAGATGRQTVSGRIPAMGVRVRECVGHRRQHTAVGPPAQRPVTGPGVCPQPGSAGGGDRDGPHPRRLERRSKHRRLTARLRAPAHVETGPRWVGGQRCPRPQLTANPSCRSVKIGPAAPLGSVGR